MSFTTVLKYKIISLMYDTDENMKIKIIKIH